MFEFLRQPFIYGETKFYSGILYGSPFSEILPPLYNGVTYIS